MSSLHNQTPICVPCRANYFCQRNGVKVRLGENAIIDTDLYECPGCHHQIIKGFANQPVKRFGEHSELFAAWDLALGPAVMAAPHMNEVYA